MVGNQMKYDGSLSQNSLNLFDVSMIAFGITSLKDESKFKILIDSRPDQCKYKKLVIRDNLLKALFSLADQ